MTTVTPISIAIVGAGNLSSKRIYPYIASAGAKLVGVCDLDEERAQAKCALYGGTPYSNIENMLESEHPEGVIICIGAYQHAKLAPIALRMGVPVYTEKPPAPCAREALALAKLSKDTNTLCTTAFKKRYSRVFQHAKQWLGQFSQEHYLSISTDYCSGSYANTDVRSSFLLDFAIHHIDLITYLFGDVDRVACLSKELSSYAVSVKFINGAVGTMNLNSGRSFTVPTEEVEITVDGGNFMTISNSNELRICENGKPCFWRKPPTFTSGGDSGEETGHLAELEDFFIAIRGKRTTRSNIYESYKSLVFYEAIKVAAETGEFVDVQYKAI